MASDAIGNVQSIFAVGKAIHDRVKKVRQIKKNNKELEDRLNAALKRVKKLTSGDFTDSPSNGEACEALKRLHCFILDAKKFTNKIANKKHWKKVVHANYITGRFESLNNDLSCFQADMAIALQVNAVEERTEIYNMLKELKDSQQNYISTVKDDFEAAKTELEENLKQIQQGM